MPIEARVFVAEDDPSTQDLIGLVLTDNGHRVVLSARTREEALGMISQFAAYGIQVAVLGGNLDSWKPSGDPDHDSQVILRAIRDAGVQVKTVGLSLNEIPGVDVDLGKERLLELGETITHLQ